MKGRNWHERNKPQHHGAKDSTMARPRDVTQMLRDIGTAQLSPQERQHTLERLEEQAVSIMSTFTPLDIARSLNHYGKMRQTPGRAVLEGMQHQALCRLQDFDAQSLTMAIHAFGKLGIRPTLPGLLEGLERTAVAMMGEFQAQGVANTLWGYASLSHRPGSGLLPALSTRALAVMPGFTPQAIANTLWSYARLGVPPP
eukprot:CAMPEP_0173392502 /NCGR_PEP_ID=MMETSP1356-20130122/19881_1 /TAXON_ID=77927 ORGANISM="Hemiselmis virescens, Strain PCC157" /NCGR_SAMPLE_ID=MMETSP1356 /ASSEMBLY_ACC=CAM_ASM_000847 /LENGTH=198 /DNA_ID=CAMNT_0014350313 /DNA_START=205 /DNA_END=797 /DNA_ORIENTATION=+